MTDTERIEKVTAIVAVLRQAVREIKEHNNEYHYHTPVEFIIEVETLIGDCGRMPLKGKYTR